MPNVKPRYIAFNVKERKVQWSIMLSGLDSISNGPNSTVMCSWVSTFFHSASFQTEVLLINE